MGKREKGTRVGAILSANAKAVRLLGFGTYQGDEVPEGAGGFMGEAMAKEGLTNPKILLDNGDVVWGCECYWGGEEAIKKAIAGRKTEEVRIADVRARDAEGRKAEEEGQ